MRAVKTYEGFWDFIGNYKDNQEITKISNIIGDIFAYNVAVAGFNTDSGNISKTLTNYLHEDWVIRLPKKESYWISNKKYAYQFHNITPIKIDISKFLKEVSEKTNRRKSTYIDIFNKGYNLCYAKFESHILDQRYMIQGKEINKIDKKEYFKIFSPYLRDPKMSSRDIQDMVYKNINESQESKDGEINMNYISSIKRKTIRIV